MAQMFNSFLLTSVIGTALALILTLLRPATRKVFSCAWHYYMWLAVLIVMILPIRLNLPESFIQPTPTGIIAIESNEIQNNQITDTIQTQVQIPNEQHIQKDVSAYIHPIKNFLGNNALLLSYIWLIVAIVLFIIKITGYIIFLNKIKKYSEPVLCVDINAYTDKSIKTRVSDTIGSPLVVGIFKPTLLLPKADITCEQLHNILAHEMTHLKRNDILYKWFLSIVKCIHWFNPVIYFIGKQINIDCEISCDLEVVRQMDEQQEKGYIETILSLLTHNNPKSIPLTTGMTGNKKTLIKRFIMIRNRIKTNKKIAITSGILAVLILLTTLFASGILNGTFFKTNNNSIMELNTDKATGNDFNLLFVGLDNNNRADTIMLLTVEENGIKALSIPRNTLLEDKRISDILATDNGNQKLIDTLKSTIAVPIHYYAEMNLTAIKEIVDNVGGIDFDVPMDMVYEDPYQDLHINLKKGVHTLNGDGVCQLLQFRRGYPNGDLSRIQLHQQFIKEFIKQKLNKENIDKAPEIFKVISDNVKTNYPISNLKHDIKIIGAINSNNIILETISGRVNIHNEMAVYELSSDNQVTEVQAYNNPTVSKSTANNIPVYNSSRKIKSLEVSSELYAGFEHLILNNASINRLKQELNNQGIAETTDSTVDLTENYIVKEYSLEQTKVKSDANGNISVYLSVNSDNLFDINFYDAETGEDVGGYGILANNENAYTFIGFEQEKSYNVEVLSKTKNDWVIDGEYIIY